jgi:hypothetical protein
LIPINLNKLKREDELNIYDAYSADLQTQQKFTLEVKRWKARWEYGWLQTTTQKAVFFVWNY